MRERTFAVLRRILANPGRDRERQKASDYYAACMDEASIEAQGIAPLEPVLSRIAALNDRNGLPALIAFLHSVAFQPAIPLRQPGYGALFDFRSEERARQQLASLNQGGIALPNRDLYLSTDERSRILRDRFNDCVRQVFTMLGLSSDEASAGARAVLAIETALASASADVLGQRALDAHRISLAALQALTPHFDWTGYCGALLLLVGGCAAANAAKAPINGPLRPNPTVTGFRRVLVAGFVPSGSDQFKLNEETARILRMELRSKASLQVIETEPLQLAVSPDARSKDSPGPKAADEVFANVGFWRRLGEEYSEPLILTGTVALTSLAPQYEERQVGPRAVRVWRRGAKLTLRLVFISGTTGAIIDSAILP